MENNYEYIFFKFLCDALELSKFDEHLLKEGIKMIDEENSENRISKYFSLVSHGSIEYLNEDNKKMFKEIFEDDLENIINNKQEQAIEFIKATYKDYFHLNEKVEYNYYGPINDEFLAPSNCIVVGLNYVKFQIEAEDYDKELFRQEREVTRILNYIQGPLAEEKGFKIATLAYNEVTLSQPFAKI